MKRNRIFLRAVLITLSALLLLCAGLSFFCYSAVQQRMPSLVSPEDAPVADCIVVPATGSHTDISPKMKSRLDAAIQMYERGLSDTIILTGRDREPELLQRYLLEQGIPDDALVLDSSGIDFLNSMRFLVGRGRCLFCVEPLHAARAAYLAEGVGAEIVCVEASDNPPVFYQYLREYFAATKAVLEITFCQ